MREAVQRINADFNRSADTHLIKVDLPGFPDQTLYLKDESTHPTGSLKHRLARSRQPLHQDPFAPVLDLARALYSQGPHLDWPGHFDWRRGPRLEEQLHSLAVHLQKGNFHKFFLVRCLSS